MDKYRCPSCNAQRVHRSTCPTGMCLVEVPEPLWERELLNGTKYNEGIGKVAFYNNDHEVLVVLNYVRVDSISNVGSNRGTITAECENGIMYHVPFVAYWIVSY